MKKVILGFATVLMLFAACKKEDNKVPPTNNDNGGNDTPVVKEIVVPEINVSLVNKLTGSNCPPCGAWGWTAFEEIITENDSNALYIGTYSQNFVAQLFITNVATDMDKMFGNSGYPTFVANGLQQLDRPDGNVSVEGEIAKVKSSIAAHTADVVYVNSGLRTTISGDSMIIDTKTKFFKDYTGDFYLAVYVMENKVKGYQEGNAAGSNTLHHHVLRAAGQLYGAATTESFGYKINTDATTTSGTVLDNKFYVNVKGYNHDNLEVAVVVWRKIGIKYRFVNAYGIQPLK